MCIMTVLMLQLKLKRAEKAKTRDKAAGVWHIYHAVGGAITVLNKEKLTETL